MRSTLLIVALGNSTIDFIPFLSITPALAFRAWLGGEEVINKYCHDLALRGGSALAKVLGTSMMGNAEEITLNMVRDSVMFSCHDSLASGERRTPPPARLIRQLRGDQQDIDGDDAEETGGVCGALLP